MANNLSNELEAYVVSAAGDIDIDDVLNADSPIDDVIKVMGDYLNLPGEMATCRVVEGCPLLRLGAAMKGSTGTLYDSEHYDVFVAALLLHVVTAAGRLCITAAKLRRQMWCGRAQVAYYEGIDYIRL